MIGVVVGLGYLSPFSWDSVLSKSILEWALIVVLATTLVAIPLLMVRFLRVAIHLDSLPVVLRQDACSSPSVT